MMSHTCILITLILAGGILGGAASYAADNTYGKLSLLKRLVLGVAAAAVVPMFLNMISSSILEEGKSSRDYFIFLGFCVVAGFTSKAFLTSVSKQVLDRVENIEEQQNEFRQDIDPILEKETEPDGAEGDAIDIDLDDEDKKVMKALTNEKYSRRSITGLERATGLKDINVIYSLEKLCSSDLVRKKDGPKRALYWLTREGRNLQARIDSGEGA